MGSDTCARCGLPSDDLCPSWAGLVHRREQDCIARLRTALAAVAAERDAAVERAERARADALEEAAALIERDECDNSVRLKRGETVTNWIRRQQGAAIRALRTGADTSDGGDA